MHLICLVKEVMKEGYIIVDNIQASRGHLVGWLKALHFV